MGSRASDCVSAVVFLPGQKDQGLKEAVPAGHEGEDCLGGHEYAGAL